MIGDFVRHTAAASIRARPHRRLHDEYLDSWIEARHDVTDFHESHRSDSNSFSGQVVEVVLVDTPRHRGEWVDNTSLLIHHIKPGPKLDNPIGIVPR